MLESSIHNLRLALRELRAHLFGSLVVVISVAIAIGANATLLTWTSALVLSPLGELDDDGLVEVATSHPVHGFAGLSDYEYEDGIEASRSLAQLIAFDETAVS